MVSKQVIYEHPLNEKMRSILRLEHLFQQVECHLSKPEAWSSRAAIEALLGMTSIFSRSDMKSELIKELGRQHATLSRIRQTPGVDMQRLDDILNELDSISEALYRITGQIGQQLRKNEFLQAITQRGSIPGGNCAFDLPLYHYWLERPYEQRLHDLRKWMQTLKPVQDGVTLLLSLIRGSSTPSQEQALSGFFRQNLDTHALVHLIRVGLPRDVHLFAEVSGGKHRFTIRFLQPEIEERPVQTGDDVAFSLTCCNI